MAPPLAYFVEIVRFAAQMAEAPDPYRVCVHFAGVAQW
jgi:hypothetical protein